MKAKAGDRIKATTKNSIFEGILLPRPEMLSQDITVIKLSTGYNIGIETRKIKKLETIKKYKEPSVKKKPLKKKKGLPTVAILSTGGTISSKIDYRTGGVYADYTAEDFAAMCPEIEEIANIRAEKIMSKMSEDFTAKDWERLAKAVLKVIDKVDGIVITQGTDTMHYTAAALNFLLKNITKPIVITGAQRSIDRGSSDAFMNLTCAVTAAARWNGAGAVTCMHATINDDYCQLIRGTKARKMHTSRRDAFRAVNNKPLAKVYPDGRIEEKSEHAKRREGRMSLQKYEPNVKIIYAYPGMNPEDAEKQLKGAKGAVITATALGHVPASGKSNIMPVLKKAGKKMPLFLCTQTIYGRVHPYVYSNLRKLSMDIGAVFLEDMLAETAYVKLMAALKQKNPEEYMKTNIAGEITKRELHCSFLQ